MYRCYGYFAKHALASTILELSLGIGTVIANVFTFFLILSRNIKRFVLEKIMLYVGIVDFLVGGFVFIVRECVFC